jgi:flagellar biosynthesis/type III secretory pathway protein FliH
MKSINFKKIAAVSALGLAIVVGTSETASAQNRNKVAKQRQKIEKQKDKIERQQDKLASQRLKLEQQRLKLERERLQQQRQAQNRRYRVNRSGSWYNVDQRQADLLRQAVNEGYRQGLTAGRQDRNYRRAMNWGMSSTYRNGTYGYQSYVDRSLYQHYFQQGFQKGYQDGYNSTQRYGSYSNGSVSILGSILGSILNLQQF